MLRKGSHQQTVAAFYSKHSYPFYALVQKITVSVCTILQSVRIVDIIPSNYNNTKYIEI